MTRTCHRATRALLCLPALGVLLSGAGCTTTVVEETTRVSSHVPAGMRPPEQRLAPSVDVAVRNGSSPSRPEPEPVAAARQPVRETPRGRPDRDVPPATPRGARVPAAGLPVTARSPASVNAPRPEPTPQKKGVAGTSIRDPNLVRAVARFRNTRIPLKQRKKELAELGRRGDEDAVRILMAVGDDTMYLNHFALKVLGRVKKPVVKKYLRDKLADVHTHDVVCLLEVIKGAPAVLGREAIPALAGVLTTNRTRDDGHAPGIASACVQALGGLGLSEATPTLAEELDFVMAQKRPDLAYGAEIVHAFSSIGDPRGRPILLNYADWIAEHLPTDPEPRGFFEQKIVETRAVADDLLPH